MRLKRVLLLIPFFLFVFRSFAVTYQYPADKPVFSISFPKEWMATVSDDVLHAGPYDNSIYFGVWNFPEDMDLENAGEAIGALIGDMVIETEFTEPELAEHNGISFLNMTGVGKDINSGDPLNIFVSFFSPDSFSGFILLYFGTPAAELKYYLQLTDIKESIKLIF